MNDASSLIHTLFHNLSTVYDRESDQILQEQLGIGLAQYRILNTLLENPATQQKQIAFSLGQTEASVSRQIKLLNNKDLLKSQVNPQNRREHQTVLTAQGKKLTKNAQKILQNYQVAALQHLSVKDQTALLKLLAKVVQA